MAFNSDVFLFGFLPIVFALFWTLRTKQQRYVLLALAGYLFYAWWDWRFCALLLYTSLSSFAAGLAIQRSTSDRRRRTWLALSLGSDLLLLGFFKYYDFFTGSLTAVVPGLGLPVLRLVLPLGISFYTFTTMSYVLEVASGTVQATTNVWEYLAFVNLFPKLIAGPITRFSQLREDLGNIDAPARGDWIARGVGFFVVGIVKKIVIADHIGRAIDPLLASHAAMASGQAWIALFGYAGQLYFDFSGYSDMAIGVGYLFALRLPQNFNAPYRALSLMEFWRRWHITLNAWLFDFIYMPATAGRGLLRNRFAAALIVVFLASGLWHGAGWTFVLWGLMHGIGMVIHFQWGEFYRGLCRRDRSYVKLRQTRPYRTAAWALTQGYFLLSLVLFRSTDLTMAAHWAKAMFVPAHVSAPIAGTGLGWIVLALLWIGVGRETWEFKFPPRRRWAVAYAVAFLATYFWMNGTDSVFLYRQF